MAWENLSLEKSLVRLLPGLEKSHLRSSVKVFGGESLVTLSFQSVRHVEPDLANSPEDSM